ncbi:ATP-binding cassette domain-containing protein [Williamsia maris]|uniref:ABC-2 type transport system ATP-binding protein n=1 Tax=Williamsia maris TaxID=72806 RepID=A0ABT1H7Q1_9NOCA|nr:ATP-binding cassette domain-containing protein [Williamsia maris]MCP2174292.1 ABC-2 type transport system ATP-binding protein [Williamsia maris]
MTPGDRPAIETHALTKTFGSMRAVDGVDLVVPQGSVYAVLGPNGAGKTTTVRMLATLLRPDGGSARVFGRDVVAEATEVRSMIGVTGQYASVDEDLTATENLMVFSRLLGRSRRHSRARAHDLLEQFGLQEAASKTLKNFSGGMRRRLDLAASLISRPPLLFLDEPTTGLDPRTRAQMWDTVRQLVAEGSTILLTTQYLEEADQLADRIAVIDRGRVVAEGTADGLKSSVGSSALVLTPAEPTAVALAFSVAERHVPTGAVTAAGDGTLTVALTDLAVVGRILVALGSVGIELAEVNVVKPSLDDVFFSITGVGEDAA